MAGPPIFRPPILRGFLFLIAMVLPAAVLVFLTWRLLALDRELAVKRQSDELVRLTERARTLLVFKADQLRRRALVQPGAHPAVVAVGAVADGQIIFRWERSAAASRAIAELNAPRLAAAIRAGEQLEYNKQPADAQLLYQQALTRAVTPAQRAAVLLLIARSAVKATHADVAAATYRLLLATPMDVVDEEDVPYALYAVRGIGRADAAVATAIEQIITASPSPPVVFMLDDVCRQFGCAQAIADRLASKLADARQLLALRDALPLIAPSDAADPVWASIGNPPLSWSASIIPDDRGLSHLVVLRTAALLADLPEGVATEPGTGGSLAPNFPGITVALTPARAARIDDDSRARRPLFIAALVTVLAIATGGAYLFWRDVQRDIALAAMRSQFVSSVSHELKTPLTAIRISAETLIERPAEQAVHRAYLDTIINETDRLTRLLNNVLEFAAVESGSKSYRLVSGHLPDIVRSAIRGVDYLLSQQQFELVVDIDGDLPPMDVDADAVQQAVLNLLSNAMKYSGASRRITLSVRRADRDVVISVSDQGIGIAGEEHERIFQQFYRVRSEATARIPGTGLGLTLVQHVAQVHGGRVTLESAPGAGSTFALRLPYPEDAS